MTLCSIAKQIFWLGSALAREKRLLVCSQELFPFCHVHEASNFASSHIVPETISILPCVHHVRSFLKFQFL